MDFNNGLNELISIVRTFEGDSIGMQKVDDLLKSKEYRF